MLAETTPSRKGNSKYTVVFLPSDQSKKLRSFSVNAIGMAAIALTAIGIIISLVLVAIVYTPLGRVLPIASPELERLYGQKVTEIQRQLNSLVVEVTTLQSYNERLRIALGENAPVSAQMPEKKSNDRLRRSSDIENDVRQRDIVQEEYSTLNQARGTQGDISRQENVDTLRWRTQSGNYLPLTMPVLGYQTKQYTGEQHHEGIDIVAKEGSPVVAAANGTIIYSDWTLDDGMMIIIAHGAGLTTVYKHNKALLKRRGAIVKRGETVALLGNTGRTSTGPHLHFEVWNNGIALNPMNYLITIQ